MFEPRYVKQRDQFSCGPVAIINILKWSGERFDCQDIIGPIQKLCKCSNPTGTNHPNFDKALRATTKMLGGFHVRRVYKPKLPEVEKHLREGGVVALNYSWRPKKEKRGRHFMLLTGVSETGKSFLTVNDRGCALRRETRASIKNYNFRFQRTDPHFKAWFISLKE